jgi:hypothetical protein
MPSWDTRTKQIYYIRLLPWLKSEVSGARKFYEKFQSNLVETYGISQLVNQPCCLVDVGHVKREYQAFSCGGVFRSSTDISAASPVAMNATQWYIRFSFSAKDTLPLGENGE